MKTFTEYLEEKLITFGGKAYPKFGQVVIISGGAGCFEKGTLVESEHGLKPIEEIKAGDLVWSMNLETNEKELKEVLRVPLHEEHDEDLLELTFEGDVIRCTEGHLFYSEGDWIPACELGEPAIKVIGKATNVYDLTVADNHNFFVGTGLHLVHNSGKGFTLSNLIGIDGLVFDVDRLKELSLKSLEVQKIAKERFGVDISKFELKNPDHVSQLHDILDEKLDIVDKNQSKRFKSVLMAHPDRKPNLIFDVTLKDVKKLQKLSLQLSQLGYKKEDIHIVWVVNDFKVAMKQNRERDRMVPEDILLDTHVGAGFTAKALLDGTYDLRKYMDGDYWISLNKRGVDSKLKSSANGGSYVSMSNYFKIKVKGKPVTPIKDLSKRVVQTIASYVPELSGWKSEI